MTPPNGKERITRALRGETVDRPPAGPLAVHFCARDSGVTIEDYTLNPRVLTDCVVRYWEKYRPDAVWVSADTWVTAEAMGAAVAFPGGDQPMAGTGEPLVQSPDDVHRIPPPDPDRLGRMPLMLEAIDGVRGALGDEAFLVACFDQSPFSLACALMGIDRLMLALVDDPPLVDALLERCIEHAVAYGAALARHGADMLSTGDSPAGLIGPQRYREVALPAERRVFERLKRFTSVPLSLHICGDATAILPDMARSGADVIEFDHQVDAAVACRAVGANIALWGNLDPVGVLARGTVGHVGEACVDLFQTLRQARHPRFVLSSGCTLAVETPESNLRALFEAATRWAALDPCGGLE